MIFESNTNQILIWSISGSLLLLALLIIVICCALKRRPGSGLPTPERLINSTRYPYYDSFREFQDYVINREEIILSKELGQGSYGIVYKGMFRGSEVAVKEMRLPLCMREGWQAFGNEILTISKLRNRNIVMFIGICLTGEKPSIIMEYMQGGSVADKIYKNFRSLDIKTIIKWSLDAAKGMEFLHSHKPQPVLHRDLKSDNLLVDEHGVVKVGDFGTAKLSKQITKSGEIFTRDKKQRNDNRMSSFPGTVCWAAPEVLPPKPPKVRGRYTPAADVYSYGITLWEMVANKRPYRGYQFEFQIMDAIISGVRPEIPETCVRDLKTLLNNCWRRQPEERPSFQEIHRILDGWMTRIALVEMAQPHTTRATFPPNGSFSDRLGVI